MRTGRSDVLGVIFCFFAGLALVSSSPAFSPEPGDFRFLRISGVLCIIPSVYLVVTFSDLGGGLYPGGGWILATRAAAMEAASLGAGEAAGVERRDGPAKELLARGGARPED